MVRYHAPYKLKQHKEELRKRFKVREIGIFGSYVRGEPEENSDLDILVESKGNMESAPYSTYSTRR